MSFKLSAIHYAPAKLSNIHLQVAQGERVALLGANGSGKSSLLKIIHGLLKATSGTIIKTHLASQESMVFQRPLLMHATVKQNLNLAVAHRTMSTQSRAHCIAKAIQRAQLSGKESLSAQQLSGGEQQRLCLARALMNEPTLLLLDEPTANLDPASLKTIEQLLEADQLGPCSLILATHSFAQARRLCRRVLMLANGQLIADQAVDDFFNRPACAQAKSYIDSERF